MQGLELLRNLVESTGLPPDAVDRELQRLIQKHGIKAEDVSLSTLRIILAEYLQDVLLEAKEA
jgi:hypothetical protein